MAKFVLRRVGPEIGVDAFSDAAGVAQGGDPNWVPPLRMQMRHLLDPRKSPFIRENPHAAWVALAGDKPVGRIFVVRNERHLARHNDATGHFGFLEGIDDPAVFDALFAAAADWFEQHGLPRMAGPFSPSINFETGLLVEGADCPPMVGINHAPAHYQRHLVRLGFEPLMDLYAFVWDVADYFGAWDTNPDATAATPPRPAERVRRLAARWPERNELTLRSFDTRHFAREVELLREIYNDAWADNWGAVPVTEDEMRFTTDLMRPIMRPDWINFAYWRGEPIAVMVQTPNLNEAIAGLGGRLLPFGWAKLLWRLKVRRPKTSRIVMAGIRRSHLNTHTGKMAALLLLADAIEKAWQDGIERLEASWILAANHRLLNLVDTIEGKKCKTFRVYGRACRTKL